MLTARQLEVLSLLARGLSYDAVGRGLFISEETVRTHVRRLIGALGARNRAHAVAIAHQRGLMSFHRTDGKTDAPRLSARQQDVLEMTARGTSYREMSEALGVSLQSVKRHMALMFKALGAQERTHAVALGIYYGLLVNDIALGSAQSA